MEPTFQPNAEPTDAELAAMVVAARAAVEAHEAACADEHETAKRANGARELARRRRAEVGRLLGDARKRWPERGPRAKGWTAFLQAVGVTVRTAHVYIRYAEVSEASPDAAEMPSYAEAGLDRRAGKPAIERLGALLEKVAALFVAAEPAERMALASLLDNGGTEILLACAPNYSVARMTASAAPPIAM